MKATPDISLFSWKNWVNKIVEFQGYFKEHTIFYGIEITFAALVF